MLPKKYTPKPIPDKIIDPILVKYGLTNWQIDRYNIVCVFIEENVPNLNQNLVTFVAKEADDSYGLLDIKFDGWRNCPKLVSMLKDFEGQYTHFGAGVNVVEDHIVQFTLLDDAYKDLNWEESNDPEMFDYNVSQQYFPMTVTHFNSALKLMYIPNTELSMLRFANHPSRICFTYDLKEDKVISYAKEYFVLNKKILFTFTGNKVFRGVEIFTSEQNSHKWYRGGLEIDLKQKLNIEEVNYGSYISDRAETKTGLVLSRKSIYHDPTYNLDIE